MFCIYRLRNKEAPRFEGKKRRKAT